MARRSIIAPPNLAWQIQQAIGKDFSTMTDATKQDPAPFRFATYRHAKGKVLLIKPANADGFKSRIDRLAEAKGIGARYVHRARGYILSARAAEKMTALYLAGFDASAWTGEVIAPRQGVVG